MVSIPSLGKTRESPMHISVPLLAHVDTHHAVWVITFQRARNHLVIQTAELCAGPRHHAVVSKASSDLSAREWQQANGERDKRMQLY